MALPLERTQGSLTRHALRRANHLLPRLSPAKSAQDEDKEANLQQLERVPVDTILEAKRAAEEADRLKAELSKQLRVDWFRDDAIFD